MGVYKFETIYLGKAGIQDWDTSTTHNNVVENRNSFKDYNSTTHFGDNLFRQREQVTVTSNNPHDARVYEDSTAFTYKGSSSFGGTITWSGGSGTIDSFIDANVTFTFTDGSTYTGSVRFMQTKAGDTFLLSYDFQSSNYTTKALDKIYVNSVTNDRDYLIEHEYNDRPFPCFAKGTRIESSRGNVLVEDLRTGDLVRTKDSGPQEIRWIGGRELPAAALEASPNLRPIRIRPGALGPDTPMHDLVVSPQHRILLKSKIVHRMFGETMVLTAAKHLLAMPGVEIAEDYSEVTYFHFMLDQHDIVLSNGAWTESLYLGPQARITLPAEQLREISNIFPELFREKKLPRPAKTFARSAQVRKLIERSLKNRKVVFAEADN